jgi:hypothetical protein
MLLLSMCISNGLEDDFGFVLNLYYRYLPLYNKNPSLSSVLNDVKGAYDNSDVRLLIVDFCFCRMDWALCIHSL